MKKILLFALAAIAFNFTACVEDKPWDGEVPDEVIDYTKLVINEVSGNNPGKFVEILNTSTTQTIPLAGVTLTKNNEDIWWTGTASVSGLLAPGALWTIARSNDEGTPSNDEKTGSGGITAGRTLMFQLKAPDGSVVSTFGRLFANDPNGNQLNAPCTISYDDETSGGVYSFSRMSDGSYKLATPSPQAANGASQGEIVTVSPS